MEYDIIIPTWNSARTLRQCLESIRKYASPHRIIVIDRNSKNGTRELAQKYACEVIDDDTSLGSARMKGIEASDCPWVAFIDSDIAIRDGWENEITSYINSRTGAVQGRTILISSPIREMRLHDARTKLFKSGLRYLKRGDRGFTNTTIIRRKLLLDLDISNFDAWEDYAITQCVLDNGYEWKYVPVFVDHLESPREWLGKIRWGTHGRKRVFHEFNISTKEQLSTIMRSLLWYLSQALKYTIIIGDNRILPLFTKAFWLELKAMTEDAK